MPRHPDPTSLAARLPQYKALARVARCAPQFLPSSTWNASKLVTRNTHRHPDALAVAFEDRRYTWREVEREVNRYAQAFRKLGIGVGDTVSLLMDNRPEFIFANTGLCRLRAKSALINTNITGAGLVHAITIAEPKKVLVGVEHEDKLLEIRGELAERGGLGEGDLLSLSDGDERQTELPRFDDVLADASDEAPTGVGESKSPDHFTYIYTSGTTGLPKAAIISHTRYLLASSLFGRGIFDAGPGDVVYCSLPLYHSNAMFAGWGTAITSGAAVALRRKFSASQFWDDVRKFDASLFIYIGELCRYLLNQPQREGERDHRIRMAAGNGLRPDIWTPFQERFGIPLIREFYGATEGTAPVVNFAGIPGMVGRLMPRQHIVRCDLATGEVQRDAEGRCQPVEPGETGLLLGGINKVTKFDGYLDRKASDKKVLTGVFEEGDTWFDTGDLITLHPGGWMSFADRIGDTFRWKGENVSANEVAEALNSCEGLLEANVYGVEVPGSEGRAGMASLNVDDSFSLDTFSEHVMKNLPVYQRPYFVRVQGDMRITGTFKHQKVDYRKEGYDPNVISDALYFLEGEKYVPLDAALYESIQSGKTTLR